MTQKILIFGTGWLGTKLKQYLGAESTRARITDLHQIRRAFNEYQPDIVLNAAGIGGAPSGVEGPKNIDWCVLSKSNRQQTWHVNVDGAQMLASECERAEVPFVHLSSGCIFDGDAPSPGGWTEEDKPCPVSYYSGTKVYGECKIREVNPEALIIRPRLPMDSVPHPRNTITKLASYPNVMDVVNSVSMVSSLLFAIKRLIEKEARGVYHATNPGSLRNAELMEWYREIVDERHEFALREPQWFYDEMLCIEQRSNCILDISKLMREGIVLGNTGMMVRDALRIYARELEADQES